MYDYKESDSIGFEIEIESLKGSDHLAHSWGDLGRFLGSQ